eukprot:TRINITY_DN2993_c0_g1_i1.p1 TRINITY_DN2993_c0_g1~~TRINITY_DN2993_c0_g1_i1.p1  ORF type:complete len:351 (-),score=64.11 TRINITY_DN2993_c0_g1_i1:121-1119(-)
MKQTSAPARILLWWSSAIIVVLVVLSANCKKIDVVENRNDGSTLAPPTISFGLMSYNIRSGSNISDIYNLTATAAAIRSFNVDFVGLQEVDNDTARHPGQDQPILLGEMTGLVPSYAVMRYFEGGFYGVATLSSPRFPILETQIWRYNNPNTTSPLVNTPPQDCGNPVTGDYCQGILALRVALDPMNETQMWFCTTHIGIGTEIQEAEQIPAFINSLDPQLPTILTGDFNSIPSSPAIQFLINASSIPSSPVTFVDMWAKCSTPAGQPGYTFNSSMPTERIDYHLYYQPPSFTDYQLACQSIEVGVTEASDHRPVVATYNVIINENKESDVH